MSEMILLVDDELLCAMRGVLRIRELHIENRRLTDLVRQQRGLLTAQSLELDRLERRESSIARVKGDTDGSYIPKNPRRVKP